MPSAADLHAEHASAMREIAHGRQRIGALLDEVKALTEREVLACRNALSALSDTARQMIADSDRNADASIARSEEMTSRFVGEMQDDVQAQQSAVAAVLSLADGIEAALAAIDLLAQDSNILALNVAIEAARAGEHGRGFVVIADYMRDLAVTIRSGTDRVRSSIGGVRDGLPHVMTYAASINERTNGFIDVVAEQVRSASQRDDDGTSRSLRLDAVVELSKTALSHLQFRDPLVQTLHSINNDLDALEARVRLALDGELNTTTGDAPLIEVPVVRPGKMTLVDGELHLDG